MVFGGFSCCFVAGSDGGNGEGEGVLGCVLLVIFGDGKGSHLGVEMMAFKRCVCGGFGAGQGHLV